MPTCPIPEAVNKVLMIVQQFADYRKKLDDLCIARHSCEYRIKCIPLDNVLISFNKSKGS